MSAERRPHDPDLLHALARAAGILEGAAFGLSKLTETPGEITHEASWLSVILEDRLRAEAEALRRWEGRITGQRPRGATAEG